MNTSMTINATAAWLLALYVANADEQGAPSTALRGTTQNDIVKEYLSRGTYIFPPEPSKRLIVDMVAWCAQPRAEVEPDERVLATTCRRRAPRRCRRSRSRWPPRSTCSTRCATAARCSPSSSRRCSASISFFVNAGIRFVEEICKLRAFTELWDRIGLERYGVTDAKARRFRYGVQVNSLGLTEAQPENNVQRIVLEMLAVTLSKKARARSVQLPAWNEALGLPRPWDQQWSLRMQQVLAFETDLLEYGDIFDGSTVIEAKTARAARRRVGRAAGRARSRRRVRRGRRAEGSPGAVDGRAHAPHRGRRADRGGRQRVSPRPSRSPLGGAGNILTVDPAVEAELVADVARMAGHARRRGRRRGAGRAAPRGRRRRQHHGAVDRAGPGRRHHRRVGGHAARGVRRVPRPHRRVGRGRPARSASWPAWPSS